MTEKCFVRLPHRAVLEIGGEDRSAFLQGLVSNDVGKAGPDRAVWAAFLTPQGKFLFDLFIVEKDGLFLIETEAERIDDLRRRLSLYKLRSKVTIALAPGYGVYAVPGQVMDLEPEAGRAKALGGGVAFVDPRLAGAGLRALLPSAEPLEALGLAEAPFAAWDEMRIRLGLPDGSRDLPVEKAILLENGFDELGGVDFQKGCYMGQELTARTKYRGLVRKRLLPVTIEGSAPEWGTPLMLGEVEAGEMRSSADGVGLAMIRLEHFAEGRAFTAGGARLVASKPDWAVLPEA